MYILQRLGDASLSLTATQSRRSWLHGPNEDHGACQEPRRHQFQSPWQSASSERVRWQLPQTRRPRAARCHRQELSSRSGARRGYARDRRAQCPWCSHEQGGFAGRGLHGAPRVVTGLQLAGGAACSRQQEKGCTSRRLHLRRKFIRSGIASSMMPVAPMVALLLKLTGSRTAAARTRDHAQAPYDVSAASCMKYRCTAVLDLHVTKVRRWRRLLVSRTITPHS